MYSNIVRAFLGTEITQLLAINCCNNIYLKHKLLIERYAMLEHMPFIDVDHKIKPLIDAIDIYDISAFGDSVFLKELRE